MTETYKAGEIEVSVKLDTSALKGEFAALNQAMAKSGQDASKGFFQAIDAEFKGSKDKFKSSFSDIFNASKEARKAGVENAKALAEAMAEAGKVVAKKPAGQFSKILKDRWRTIRTRTKKGLISLTAQLQVGLKAMGGAMKAAITSTGIGLLFEGLAFGVSKLIDLANGFFNSAAIAAEKAGETLQDVGSDIEGLGTAYQNLTSKTQTLEQQTLELNKAIDGSGSAAETAAKKELEAINKRIRKNKELQRVYLDDARSKLRTAREAEKAADNYALAKIFTSFRGGRTNVVAKKLKKDSEYALKIGKLVEEEQERLRKKEQSVDELTKKERKRFDAITKYDIERAENAQKILEAEQLVAALETPIVDELKTPENNPAADATSNADNADSDSIPEKDCDRKCDEKVRRVEARQKEAPEPTLNKEAEEAARKAEEEAELHRQRIDHAKELKRQADGPLGAYRAQLERIKEVERNDEAAQAAGGDQNIQSAKLDALRELASATEDYGLVLNELDKLLKADEITVEQYGQAFQNVIQSISDTDKALELLGTRAQNDILGDSLIKKDAIDEANKSLKTSEEYLEAINAEKREALELEAQEIENKILLAEIGEGEPVDVKALRERLAIIRENLDLLQRGFTPEQAEKIAPKLVQTDEYNDLKDDVKDLFKGGIKAAIDGDFEEFLSGKLQSAADSMFDNALDALLNGLFAAEGPLAGLFHGGEGGGGLLGAIFGDGKKGGVDSIFSGLFGGGKPDEKKDTATDVATDALGKFTDGLTAAEGDLGGFGGALSSIFGQGGLGGLFGGGGGIGGLLGGLFAGFFADGGVVPRGQFAIVGEEGPEVISSGASPLRVTPINDNYAAKHTARVIPDGGGGGLMQYAPVNNFYGHTQDDLRRSLDERDRALKSEMPGMMDRHNFNRKRGMA